MHEDNAAFSQIGGARINLMKCHLSVRRAFNLSKCVTPYLFGSRVRVSPGNIIALAKYRGSVFHRSEYPPQRSQRILSS